MSSLSTIGLISSREISTRVRTKSFVWTTIVMVGLIVAGSFAMKVASEQSSPAQQIGLSAELADHAEVFELSGEATDVDITTTVMDEEEARSAIASGDIEVWVSPSDSGLTGGLNVLSDEQPSSNLETTLNVVAQQLALTQSITDAGADPQEILVSMAGATLHVTTIQESDPIDGARVLTGILAGILLFVTIMIGGQNLAVGVVEEKTSRVVELLLATVRPWQLMIGKIIGVGTVGLIQVGSVAVAGFVSAQAFGLFDASGLDITTVLLWTVLWFVIGYTMYAVLIAALSSLVSRQEEVASVISPVTWLMMIPYVLGVTIVPGDPESALVRTLSLVPFFSPILMPIRIAFDVVSVGDLILSVALSVTLVVALLWLAQRIYRNAITRTGARIKLRNALGSA